MDDQSVFVFVTCQVGAEPTVKREIALHQPGWRFCYSRPGFLTFKATGVERPDEKLQLRSVFARTWAVSLGRAAGGTVSQRAQDVWRLAGELDVDRLHVWPRDIAAPGHRGFAPGMTEQSLAARDAIIQARATVIANGDDPSTALLLAPTGRGDLVLDCVVAGGDEWWVGWHRAAGRASCWPGGIWPGHAPEDAVSRAYAKISEAIDWSALPIKPGQRCADVGCAPGGGSQALLDRGLRVVGIDPADVDPQVLAHRNFQHVRCRGADLQRRAYRDFQWLVADMNLVPSETLAIVRDIVTHRLVNIRGLIMNLKLADWSMSQQADQFLAEVHSWGYHRVRARQLSHNRLEMCVVALKRGTASRRRRRFRRAKKARTAIKIGSTAANRG